MKQVLFSLLALGFGLGLVLISMIHLGKQQMVGAVDGEEVVVNEEVVVMEASDEAVVVPTPLVMISSQEDGVDYYLPYPGLLPDHPLYFLKMVRDRFRVWLAGDKEAKVGELMMCADKRIGAALVLVEGNKTDLGVTTALKAEQYLKQAADLLKELENDELKERVGLAVAKHEEVLRGIEERVEGGNKAVWEEAWGLNGMVKAEYELEEESVEEGAVMEESDEDERAEESEMEVENVEEYYPVEISM